MKQLIDLNGDTVNFDLTFTATSKDGSVFDILVVDQTMLDSNQPLEYKKANGTMSGNIVSDKGVYQNYFLLLKSDNQCECEVVIDIKEIEPKPRNNPVVKSRLNEQNNKPFSINWNYVISFIIIFGAGYIFWTVYRKEKPGTIVKPNSIVVPSISVSPSIASSVGSSVVPEPVIPLFSQKQTVSGGKESLLNRLNKL